MQISASGYGVPLINLDVDHIKKFPAALQQHTSKE